MSGYLLWSDGAGSVQRSEVPEHSLTVGTWATCGAVAAHDDVGPVHVALERDAIGCRLRRLSRTRPVTVNGKAANEKGLQNGDRIGLGAWEARYADALPLAPRQLVLTFTRDDDEPAIEMELPWRVTVLGRIEGEVLVDDAGVSSRHLELENFGPDFCYVRDLGSTNGSELNGVAMGLERHLLADGDVISLGRVRVSVSFGDEPSERALHTPQRTVLFVSDASVA